MLDIIDSISTWSALKWIIIVLVAGFIGQFGKSMAQAIIAKVRSSRAKKQEVKDIHSIPAKLPENKAPDPIKNNSDWIPAVNKAGPPDKKALKTLAKQKKKEAKAAKKGS